MPLIVNLILDLAHLLSLYWPIDWHLLICRSEYVHKRDDIVWRLAKIFTQIKPRGLHNDFNAQGIINIWYKDTTDITWWPTVMGIPYNWHRIYVLLFLSCRQPNMCLLTKPKACSLATVLYINVSVTASPIPHGVIRLVVQFNPEVVPITGLITASHVHPLPNYIEITQSVTVYVMYGHNTERMVSRFIWCW